MDIFIVKLQIRRNGEDYTQITPFLAEDKAIERFEQVLDVVKMFDTFTENEKLSVRLIRHASSKYAYVKLYKMKDGESDTFKPTISMLKKMESKS